MFYCKKCHCFFSSQGGRMIFWKVAPPSHGAFDEGVCAHCQAKAKRKAKRLNGKVARYSREGRPRRGTDCI